MSPAPPRAVPGEYRAVGKRLVKWGLGGVAIQTHAMPISREAAIALCRSLTGLTPSFRGYRGRARAEHVTLPAREGVCEGLGGVPYLRVGIVLHEVAHVLHKRDRARTDRRPHGEQFCRILGNLMQDYCEPLRMAAGDGQA